MRLMARRSGIYLGLADNMVCEQTGGRANTFRSSVRRPNFKTLAVHITSSCLALRRNAVFMSVVTQVSATPRNVMIASHIATPSAPINVIPLTSPPGRSNSR